MEQPRLSSVLEVREILFKWGSGVGQVSVCSNAQNGTEQAIRSMKEKWSLDLITWV